MIEPGAVPSRPVTLAFRTFADAADQAGRSRRYGGIHFKAGDLDGRRLGRRVGANAWAKASGYFANETRLAFPLVVAGRGPAGT
jgi:hypothetical protein